MVLYFSGTGNSLYIAKKIAEDFGERLISIAELVRNNQYTISLEVDESIGFVYPVHACAPPDIVTNFIKKVTFENYCDNYIYSVYNCAGTSEYTSRIMKETCEKRGFILSGFYEVLMPGNYVTVKKHLSEEKCKKYLKQADSCVLCGKCVNICPMKAITIESGKPNRHKDKCVFCLACVNVCTTQALQVGKKTIGNPRYIHSDYDGLAR